MSEFEDMTDQDFLSSSSFVEGIVETSPVGIVVVKGGGTVSFANERAEEIFGRSRQDISDYSYDDPRWDLVDEDGKPVADGEAPFDHVVAVEEKIHNQVLGLRRPSGERVWLSVNGAPQWNENGELTGAVFAFEDITERRQREKELQKKSDVIRLSSRIRTFSWGCSSRWNGHGHQPDGDGVYRCGTRRRNRRAVLGDGVVG